MTEHAPVTTWIIDDTGFLGQGSHSVGVQRQYTGSAGKITNCQVGVSLSVASRMEHIPMVRALDDKLPGEIVLADAAYGTSVEFRNSLVTYGLDYAVGINGTSKVWVARPSKADPARMNPPAPSSPRAGDGKNHPGRPSNLARVVLAAHLRPRDVARAFRPCSSRCRSRQVEAGTSRPRDRRRKRRQPEVRQDGHDHLAGRDVGHDRPPATARARENVHQINSP